jgi:hypothetical protein
VPVPEASFLAGCAKAGAFTDCYALTVPGSITLPAFVEAFYTTRLFKLERWLLAKALKLHSTDAQAAQLARGEIGRFAAWKVEQRAPDQILLDAGQTRSWLSVQPEQGATPTTPLHFGSAVVPMRPGGQFSWAFHALLGFHRAYSKALLAAAARRLRQQSAAWP